MDTNCRDPCLIYKYVIFRPELVRENHYHKIKDEIICATLVKFIPCDNGKEKCSGVIEISGWCRQ